jgi:CheY-like chemotaxis protein
VALAEDDDVQRMLLEEALRLEGFDVVTFEDGAELIDLFELPPSTVRWPDALVTDINMPGHSGLEAAALARQRGFAAPIFVVTGSKAPQYPEQAARLGNTLLLTKPLDVDALAQAIWHLTRVHAKAE